MFKTIIFTLLISLFICAGTAQADTELCMAIDSSGSIDASEFNLQIEGLAQAIEDPTVMPQISKVTVSVVQFGETALVTVPPTLIDSQATADIVAAQIRALTQSVGIMCTNMGQAIIECTDAFSDPGKRWVIDMSTDGYPNCGPDPITERDNSVATGLAALNALAVGAGADIAFLETLVWPQPASPPYDPGFVIAVPNFETYVEAIKEKVKGEVPVPVNVDIKPGSCPNPLNLKSKGVLPVAILGTDTFEVTDIDWASITLAGVSPLRMSAEYVAAPYSGEPVSCYDCTTANDMYMDLTLKFDTQEIVAALGAVNDGDCVVLDLSGKLLDGREIVGRDVIKIIMNK